MKSTADKILKISITLILTVGIVLALASIGKPSNATVAAGGFCIKATHTEGGQTATAGAPGCGAEPVEEEPEPEPAATVWKYHQTSVGVARAGANGGSGYVREPIEIRIYDLKTGRMLSINQTTTTTFGNYSGNVGIGLKDEHADLKFELKVGGNTYTGEILAKDATVLAENRKSYGYYYLTSEGFVHSYEAEPTW